MVKRDSEAAGNRNQDTDDDESQPVLSGSSVRARSIEVTPAAGRRRGALRLLPALLTLALLALLVSLGGWQLRRAGESRALLAAFDAVGAAPLPALPPAAAPGAVPRYARVRLAGRYLPERQFLLDNVTHAGVAGYRVLTPFATDAGQTVLVDRGWVPLGASRAALPALTVGALPRVLGGRIDELPRAGIELAAPAASGWPRVLNFPRLEVLRAALGSSLYPRLVLLDPAEPDGFLRNWQPAGLAPERHLGYALQWYALALTLAVLFAVASLRRPPR